MIVVTFAVEVPDDALERLGAEYMDDIKEQDLVTYLRNEVASLPIVRWTDGNVVPLACMQR